MQCVMLAAGKGFRMLPLTENLSKPLIELDGKPILLHVLSELPEDIDEIIIVVGHMGDMIMDKIGFSINGIPVSYAKQTECLGTADALAQAKHLIRGRFLLLFADDIHLKEDLKKAVRNELCLLAVEHDKPEDFGVMITNKYQTLKDSIEKPKLAPPNLSLPAHRSLIRIFFHFKSTKVRVGNTI
jgi:NDP-sugar pyrophosphorylase family protein